MTAQCHFETLRIDAQRARTQHFAIVFGLLTKVRGHYGRKPNKSKSQRIYVAPREYSYPKAQEYSIYMFGHCMRLSYTLHQEELPHVVTILGTNHMETPLKLELELKLEIKKLKFKIKS